MILEQTLCCFPHGLAGGADLSPWPFPVHFSSSSVFGVDGLPDLPAPVCWLLPELGAVLCCAVLCCQSFRKLSPWAEGEPLCERSSDFKAAIRCVFNQLIGAVERRSPGLMLLHLHASGRWGASSQMAFFSLGGCVGA